MPGAIDRRAILAGEAAQDPRPELRPVAQHEVQHRNSEYEAGQESGAGLNAGGEIAGGIAPRVGERGLEILCAVEREVERLALEDVGDLVHGQRERRGELVVLRHDGGRDDREENADEREPDEQGERGGGAVELVVGSPRRGATVPVRSSARPWWAGR